jgi:hypothetical protein
LDDVKDGTIEATKTSSQGQRTTTSTKKKSKRAELSMQPEKTKRTAIEDTAEHQSSPSLPSLSIRPTQPKPIDKQTFRKQKVKSYPRNQIHYYNRVVKPKMAATDEDKLYFVSEYDEARGLLRLIPMVASGTLLGQREGRPRYQCAIGDTDENFKTVAAADFEIVRSAVVMKTPLIAAEAWDIETDQDTHFLTR